MDHTVSYTHPTLERRNMPNRHFPSGGSSAEVHSNCAAAHLLYPMAPPQKTTPAMERGTRIHDLAEKLFKREVTITESDLADDETAAANDYVQSTYDFCKEYGLNDIKIELELQHPDPRFKEIVGGTTDGCAYSNYELFVWDLKSGYVLVDPDAAQLVFYAWLIYINYFKNSRLDRIYLGIYQYGKFKWAILEGMPMIEDAFKPFEDSLVRMQKYPIAPNVGSWCAKCKAMTVCGKFQAYFQQFKTINLNDTVFNEANVIEGMEMEKAVSKYFEAIKDKAVELAEAGNLPGYEMAPSNKLPLEWCDGAPLSESWYVREPMSPTQVAKSLGKDGEQQLVSNGLAFRPTPGKTLKKVKS